MVGGARRSGLCQERQHCWVIHAQQFPMCMKNGPPPKGHPANLTQRQRWEALESTWASIPVEHFRVHVQLNIRKVFLVFGILSVSRLVNRADHRIRMTRTLGHYSVQSSMSVGYGDGGSSHMGPPCVVLTFPPPGTCLILSLEPQREVIWLKSSFLWTIITYKTAQ